MGVNYVVYVNKIQQLADTSTPKTLVSTIMGICPLTGQLCVVVKMGLPLHTVGISLKFKMCYVQLQLTYKNIEKIKLFWENL